jgi:hypothetical protein
MYITQKARNGGKKEYIQYLGKIVDILKLRSGNLVQLSLNLIY